MDHEGKCKPIQPVHLDNLNKLPSLSKKILMQETTPTMSPNMKYLMALIHCMVMFIQTSCNTYNHMIIQQ